MDDTLKNTMQNTLNPSSSDKVDKYLEWFKQHPNAGGYPAYQQSLTEQQKTLPQLSEGNHLNTFQTVLQEALNRAGARANQSGLDIINARTKGLNMPGGSLSQIADAITQQATGGFADIYKSTMAFMRDKQEAAQKQLQTIINENALPQFSEKEITDLAHTANMEPSVLKGIRQAQIDAQTTETKITPGDRVNDLVSFLEKRKGKDGKISADDYVSGYGRWYAEGGKLSDYLSLFPPESYMNPDEIERLPSDYHKKQKIPSLKELPPDVVRDIHKIQSWIDLGHRTVYKGGQETSENYTYNDAIRDFPSYVYYLKEANH